MIRIDPAIVDFKIRESERKTREVSISLSDFMRESIEFNNKIVDRLNAIDEKIVSDGNTVESLMSLVKMISSTVSSMQQDIVSSKLNNIKQDMVVRTLLNLQQYNAHDMFVDTFTTADDIDNLLSIRNEWIENENAIGKTTKSTRYVNQPEHNTKILITGNSGDDNAICQSFVLDKTQDIDKISLYVSKNSENVWKNLSIKVTDDIEGFNILTSGIIEPSDVDEEGMYGIELSNIQLQKHKEYYITIETEDTYGYRIGVQNQKDTYFAGTSFVKFNNVWTDNNFDIRFEVWCFAAADEDDATIVTKSRLFEGTMSDIVFDCEYTVYSGSTNFFVSLDDGANWKILEPGIRTSLDEVNSTGVMRIKAYIKGNARIDAWGYVLKRGEK